MSDKPWAVEGSMFVCTTCHKGQPPYSRKEGADCIHCDGKVTEVITLDEAGDWKERAKEAEGKLYPIDGEHLEEQVTKLKAENATLGEANKWLTYGIGSWCAKADKAEERAKAAEASPDAPTREKLKEAVELIRRMAEVEWDGPCRLDHHGYCQEHGDFDEGECYVPVTKRFVEEVESENQI